MAKQTVRASGMLWKLIALLAVLGAGAVVALNAFGVSLFPTRTDPTVLETTTGFALRDIGQLVTQEAFMTRVHSESDARTLFGITFPGTRRSLVFSYDVTVKAGVDFAKASLSADPEKKTVTVTLPSPRVLDATVDPESFRVYEETGNLFNRNTATDMNSAIGTMLREGREYAVERGLLENARANAETLVRGFLAQHYPSPEYTYVFAWTVSGEEANP